MAATLAHERPQLGQELIAQGLISEDQLRIALIEQGRSQQALGKLLVELGFVTEETLREALSRTLGKASVDLARAIIDPLALNRVPKEIARRYRLLPLSFDAERKILSIALADPDDIVAQDRLQSLLGDETTIETVLAGESEILRAIEQHYGHELSIDGILREIETGEVDVSDLARSGDEYSQPVVRLVDALLADAVKREASDIHFEPEASHLRIRYRIDGLLRQIRALHRSCWAAMAVRLKVMASLNIAETRAPQDGRISVVINGRAIDFRVSVHPTLHGENIVLRVLDRHKGIVPLAGLGLTGEQLELLKRMIARPEGLILTTGPTGSGKTTTLYSILNHLSNESLNIMTLEDPVEYPTSLIRQTSISEASKLDFAAGVRAMMRQDPDVILVGEIRDTETAVMAFRAAMTGHQVYSTLHTNSALGVIPRLIDLGMQPDILAGNLIGMLGQRLVRRLCPDCRRPRAPEASELRLLGLPREEAPAAIFDPVGCPHCAFQGFRGRTTITEIVRMDRDLDERVARHATPNELLRAARDKGFRTLAEDGIRRVLDGTTSLAELARVVDLTDRMG
ncbi:GspE/PulE family protein [Niveibacterium terrae]|uniref:GspE/PulE family protein n=1 Tax=Niveibacterium terrae TaxID=3373598 RepID=UPI003A919BBB